MKIVSTILILLSIGCQSSPLQQKRDRIVNCVKDLHNNDISEAEAFEICSKVYKL